MSTVQEKIPCGSHVSDDSHKEDVFVSAEDFISFKIENKWEGIILDIKGDMIHTKIYDIEGDEYDLFNFNRNKISSDDIEFLEEGALFNFYIGYTIKNRTRKNAELIKFRRKIKDKDEINRILDTMNDIDFDSIIEDY